MNLKNKLLISIALLLTLSSNLFADITFDRISLGKSSIIVKASETLTIDGVTTTKAFSGPVNIFVNSSKKSKNMRNGYLKIRLKTILPILTSKPIKEVSFTFMIIDDDDNDYMEMLMVDIDTIDNLNIKNWGALKTNTLGCE